MKLGRNEILNIIHLLQTVSLGVYSVRANRISTVLEGLDVDFLLHWNHAVAEDVDGLLAVELLN